MTLEQTQHRFAEEIEKIQQEKQGQQLDLKRMYLSALLRRESKAQQEGDLDTLQAIRTEITRIEQTEELTAAPRGGPEVLRPLNQVVREKLTEIDKEAAGKISSLVNSIESYSERQATQHTRQGDLDTALAWRDWGRGLRERPEIAAAIALSNMGSNSTDPQGAGSPSFPLLSNLKPAAVIAEKSTSFRITPTVYQQGSEPEGPEKRISTHTPSAKGSGHALLQSRLKLIEKDETLEKIDRAGYDFKHKSYLYCARLEFGPLPGKSLDTTLLVFDLYKRGSGRDRNIIRTEGMRLPPMPSGSRWVADSGTYIYETRETDWNIAGWDRESATADLFYGFVVSIFNTDGELIFQRTNERMLGEVARETPPQSFDEPQEEN